MSVPRSATNALESGKVAADQVDYVETLEGGGTIRLTPPDDTLELFDACPAWSPDGRHIAFQRLHGYSVGLETATESAIVLIDADGTHEHLLGGN